MESQAMIQKITEILGGKTDQIEYAFNGHPLAAKLEAATTKEEVCEIYLKSPSDSEIEAKALEKLIALTPTIKDLKEIHSNTNPHSSAAYTCIRAIARLLEKEAESPAPGPKS